MSGTGFAKRRSYDAQYENESLNSLNQIDDIPAHPVVQELAVADKLNWKLGPRILVKSDGGAVVLTSIPQIDSPVGGISPRIVLEGADAADIITFSSEAALPGSNIKLAGGGTFALGFGHILVLMYSPQHGAWLELGRSVNS